MMMKFLYLSVFFSIHSIAFGQTIQNKIAQLLREQNLPGAICTIVDHNNIDYFGSGLKNLSTGERIQKDDKVNVGSITKTVLALGVMRLATEGRLDIDDPIRKYLPDLPINNPWESSQVVTVRHLLDHTSGLSDLRLWHFFSTDCTPRTPLYEFYKRNPEVLAIKAKPGTLFSYSNMGYTLLGMLIETIVKEPYETHLDKNLLQPLGLRNSTFHFVSQSDDQQLVMGHFDNGKIAPAMAVYVRPAGQFTTTAFDMGQLLQFILNKGVLNGNSFIRKEYIDFLGVPTQTIASRNGLKHGYAFGALSRDRHGVVGKAHSGNTIGFRAMYYLFPEEKKAFFIAHNMDSETADYEVFNKALIDHLDLMPAAKQGSPGQHHTLNGSTKWDGYYVPVITKIEPMELFDIISAHTLVKNTSAGLSLTPFQKKEILLNTSDNRVYWAKGKLHPSHLFYEDEYAQQYLTTGILTLKKTNGWKIALIATAFILGSLACVTLLFWGCYKLVRKSSSLHKNPVLYSFIALLVIVMAGIAVFSGGLTHTGNRNVSTILLYYSTILLPLGIVSSLFIYVRKIRTSIKSFEFWLVIMIAQFVALLAAFDVIPFATWS